MPAARPEPIRAARTAGHRGPRWAIPLRLIAPFAPLGERVGQRPQPLRLVGASYLDLFTGPNREAVEAADQMHEEIDIVMRRRDASVTPPTESGNSPETTLVCANSAWLP